MCIVFGGNAFAVVPELDVLFAFIGAPKYSAGIPPLFLPPNLTNLRVFLKVFFKLFVFDLNLLTPLPFRILFPARNVFFTAFLIIVTISKYKKIIVGFMEGVLETALLFAVISLCFGYIALFIADTNTKITQKSKPKETFVIENTNLNKYVTMDILQEDFMATDRKSRIVIELYTSVVPKTVENFYQICKTNSYAGVPFHRVINNFMIQGGDITKKDGTGGTSIYAGKPFNDENFTLKHDSEGLLSMANSGPNTNLSQFFITLAPAPHLDGKHVIFGKVIKGFQHIQNIGSSPVDFNDKPVQNISIVYTETGNNPIEDEEKPDILADDVSMNIPNPQRNAQPQVQESPLNNGLSSNSINLSTQSSFPNTEQTQSFPTGITSFQDSNTQFPEGISTFTDNTFEVTQW